MNTTTIREDAIEMRDVITMIFVLCDELLTAMNHREGPQVMMTDAEVITAGLTAAYLYGGHLENARKFLKEYGYIPGMLSESRLNRRLHAIPEFFWGALFQSLASTFKLSNLEQMYGVDSFPVPVCDNIRIDRCRLYGGEAYRGYIASKRRYFYGLRVYMIVTASGEPVEFILRPGAESDVSVYKALHFDLPAGATCFSDKMDNDYTHEDLLREATRIDRQPSCKRHSKRQISYHDERYKQVMRKHVESSFSNITRFFPKNIHAVTPKGFELNVVLFILAFGIQSVL
ncbi:transposase [Candidatus Vecturithrix granuli]|uniref:Transposase n=1 Tax=Vecturithrix granuli TaxID=1499967 RepID=A0A081C486_VECG1|nr:transposase [Candidatus Vecturithrix granuli]